MYSQLTNSMLCTNSLITENLVIIRTRHMPPSPPVWQLFQSLRKFNHTKVNKTKQETCCQASNFEPGVTWRHATACLHEKWNLLLAASVTTGMGDRRRASIQPWYVTKPTRSTQPCIPQGSLNWVPCEGFMSNAPPCGSHSWVLWTRGVL